VAAVRLLAGRLRVRSIDYGHGRVQVRFAEDAPVSPERLIGLATGRPGIQVSPGGALRIDLPPADAAADARRIEAVRGVLRGLLPCDSIPVSSHSSAAAPPNGDR
jgi:hypothetical protein